MKVFGREEDESEEWDGRGALTEVIEDDWSWCWRWYWGWG
jgi:hypothetical protein